MQFEREGIDEACGKLVDLLDCEMEKEAKKYISSWEPATIKGKSKPHNCAEEKIQIKNIICLCMEIVVEKKQSINPVVKPGFTVYNLSSKKKRFS